MGTKLTRAHLQAVAETYRAAAERGRPPGKAIAERFSVPIGTAYRWTMVARFKGLLPETHEGQPLAFDGPHRPAGARLNTRHADGRRGFVVCEECLTRWPCPTREATDAG